MSEEINKQEVEQTTPDNNEQEDLLSTLDSLEDESNKGKKLEPEGKSEKPEEGSKDYFKKVGGNIFKTEEDYDAWAQKNYGEVGRLSGELNKLSDRLKTLETQKTEAKTPEEKEQKEIDINAIRLQIKTTEFFEENPDAMNYKPIMAALIRSGKANNEKGSPDLKVAYEKALLLDGKDVNKEESIKNVMKAGGGDSGRLSANPYSSKESVDSTDNFADSILTGKIR